MTVEPLGERRSIPVESISGFSIIVPAQAHWFAVLFLMAWLGGWALGELVTVHQLLRGNPDGAPTFFLVAWLCGWTFGGFLATYSLLWMIAGTEKITLSSGVLTLRKEIFGVGREKSFKLTSFTSLRVDAQAGLARRGADGLSLPTIGDRGSVAFDHGASTVRFGIGLDEAEAAMIVEELKGRASY